MREHQAEVVGEAGTRADALRMSTELRPDAVVLDLMLPDISGRELYDMVRQASPPSRVVVYTAYASDKAWYQANGAHVVEKEDLDQLYEELVG